MSAHEQAGDRRYRQASPADVIVDEIAARMTIPAELGDRAPFMKPNQPAGGDLRPLGAPNSLAATNDAPGTDNETPAGGTESA